MVTRVDDDIAWMSYLGPAGLKWQGLCPGQEMNCPHCVVELGSDLIVRRSSGRRKFRPLFSSARIQCGPLFHVPGPCSRVD